MTQNTDNEPTLLDVVSRLDRIDGELKKALLDNEKFNDRFSNYQQATQWVVQLAFTLMASATITVIISAVLKR
jgi:hypothetical protein